MSISRPNLKRLTQVVALAAAASSPAVAQISITSPSFTYTNNFNSLASSGTPTWTDNSTMAGWYAARNASSANTPFTSYATGTGSSSTGNLYSFGTTSDRALGSIADISGATTIAYGVRLRNNTGATLTRLSIGFTGEQWRRAGGGTSANHTLTVSYRISGTVTTPDPVGTLAWTPVGALTFNTPQDSRSGGGAALDGNNAANRVELFLANISISLPNNSEIFIRWVDAANSGSDHGVAIDDVRIYVPEAGVVGPLTLVAFAAGHTWLKRRRLNRKSVASTGATPVDAPRTPAGH
jgi:hypothetical protein